MIPSGYDENDSKEEFFKFDDMYTLYVSSCYLKKFEKSIKNKKTTSSMFKLERAFASGLKELIANLLGKSRISGVCVYSSSKANGDSETGRYFFVGLIFGDRWADPIMRGPQGNTEEGEKFRSEFGEMSNIRKFADNALCESVCWVEDTSTLIDAENLSIGERYMNFICYEKLALPYGSLQRLFKWPNKWIAVVPRVLRPLTFLQNAYHNLAKHLRAIRVLSLEIVGVNCVSSYYRDTEPFPLIPVPELWRRSKNGLCYQRLNAEEQFPVFIPSIKVFITLERTGKWGQDSDVISSYKTACYVELANEFMNEHGANAIAKTDSVFVLVSGVVFKIVIVHDNELRKFQNLSGEFSTDTQSYRVTADASEATVCQQLQAVSSRFMAFGETCQVAKRWIASSELTEHIHEIAVELLVAKGFIEPVGRSVDCISPMTATSGFLQFLRLISSHNFLEEPIFVDINESFKDEDREQICQEFVRRRPVLPCICISTPEDRSGIRYTMSCPEPIVMCRLVQIAQQAMDTINALLREQSPVNYWQLCVDTSSAYDFVVDLEPGRSTRFVKKENTRTIKKGASIKSNGDNRAIALPVVDFDSTKRLVEEFRAHLGKYAIFFYNKYHADKVSILFRKNFRMPNKKDLLECAEYFECEPDPIKLHNKFRERLEKLGERIVKVKRKNDCC